MTNNVYALDERRREFDPLNDPKLKPLLKAYFSFTAIDLPKKGSGEAAYHRFSPVFASRIASKFAYPALMVEGDGEVIMNVGHCLIMQAVTAGWVHDDLHTMETLVATLPQSEPILYDWLTDLAQGGHLMSIPIDGEVCWVPSRLTLYRYIEVVAWLVRTFSTMEEEHGEVLARFGKQEAWIDTEHPVNSTHSIAGRGPAKTEVK